MPVKTILEIGCNHKGDINIAKKMIDIATNQCGADVVKFQKRCNKELLSPEQYNAPHPVPENSYGKTYGEHREFLEFNLDQNKELMDYCNSKGIEYSTSVWDTTSAKQISSINPRMIKIPSASNLHFEMLEYLCDNFDGDIHLSLGMTTHEEEDKIINFFENKGRNKDLVIYSCTSGYPVPPEDICLLEITRIKNKFADRVKAIGFSGHHIGNYPDVAALALGATYFERHFTLDKNWKGTDHSASLEPSEAEELIKALKLVKKSLTYKSTELLEIEKPQRNKLKWLRKTA